jgi:hypothetical protein
MWRINYFIFQYGVPISGMQWGHCTPFGGMEWPLRLIIWHMRAHAKAERMNNATLIYPLFFKKCNAA